MTTVTRVSSRKANCMPTIVALCAGKGTHVLHEAANFKPTQGATVLLIMGVEHVVDPEQLVPVSKVPM